jgi:excisionase family DNA binding protein
LTFIVELAVEKLLTIDELAKFIRVSTRTIYRMMDEGELPFAIKLKGSWRFKESDVLTWLESHKIGNVAGGASCATRH